MITSLDINNYKALREVHLELTPVHALIGPNDSGKTSILNALACLSRSTDNPLSLAFTGSWEGRDLVWHGNPEGVLKIAASFAVDDRRVTYTLACRFPNVGRNVVVEGETFETDHELKFDRTNHYSTMVFGVCVQNQNASIEVKNACNLVHKAISGVQYYRWNPRMLALPVAPDSKMRFRMNSDGFGLARSLDDILGYDRELFGRLEEKFCTIFSEIGSIKLRSQMAFRSPSDEVERVPTLQEAEGKGLYFELRKSKQLVSAAQASDGVLLVLGYLAVLYSPQPPKVLLIEEPENGIHPKRLRDVIGILRELVNEQSQTQVLLTTHSPYAVDLLEPSEVSLCTKAEDGSVQTTPLSDTKSVQEQKSVFTLGEIWTAEGDEFLAKDHETSAS